MRVSGSGRRRPPPHRSGRRRRRTHKEGQYRPLISGSGDEGLLGVHRQHAGRVIDPENPQQPAVAPVVARGKTFPGMQGLLVLEDQHVPWLQQDDHVTALAELEVPAPQDPQRYQVWLQTGDETLDYRLAQQYYRACALRIQAGGDHSFQGFAEQLPAMLSFAGIGADLYQAIDFTAL